MKISQKFPWPSWGSEGVVRLDRSVRVQQPTFRVGLFIGGNSSVPHPRFKCPLQQPLQYFAKEAGSDEEDLTLLAALLLMALPALAAPLFRISPKTTRPGRSALAARVLEGIRITLQRRSLLDALGGGAVVTGSARMEETASLWRQPDSGDPRLAGRFGKSWMPWVFG